LIGAVILAAGSSSRMGRAKASLPAGPGGRTFLETIRDVLRDRGIEPVRVVVAPVAPAATGPEAVVNPDPGRGMLSSVQCGIRALPHDVDALLLWPVDHPLVKAGTLVEIVAAYREGNAPVVVPVHGGRRGHPAIFASRVFHELLDADPAQGAREVVHAHADRKEIAVADPGVVTGIDTPDDYRRAFGCEVPLWGGTAPLSR
jgi:molybdenum cofactor cytidylyltransferase